MRFHGGEQGTRSKFARLPQKTDAIVSTYGAARGTLTPLIISACCGFAMPSLASISACSSSSVAAVTRDGAPPGTATISDSVIVVREGLTVLPSNGQGKGQQGIRHLAMFWVSPAWRTRAGWAWWARQRRSVLLWRRVRRLRQVDAVDHQRLVGLENAHPLRDLRLQGTQCTRSSARARHRAWRRPPREPARAVAMGFCGYIC